MTEIYTVNVRYGCGYIEKPVMDGETVHDIGQLCRRCRPRPVRPVGWCDTCENSRYVEDGDGLVVCPVCEEPDTDGFFPKIGTNF